MKKFYSFYLLILLLISGSRVYSQSRFNPVGDFTNAMNINILEAKVNGVDLVAGDEVGIFNDTIDGALSMTSYLIGDPALLKTVN